MTTKLFLHSERENLGDTMSLSREEFAAFASGQLNSSSEGVSSKPPPAPWNQRRSPSPTSRQSSHNKSSAVSPVLAPVPERLPSPPMPPINPMPSLYEQLVASRHASLEKIHSRQRRGPGHGRSHSAFNLSSSCNPIAFASDDGVPKSATFEDSFKDNGGSNNNNATFDNFKESSSSSSGQQSSSHPFFNNHPHKEVISKPKVCSPSPPPPSSSEGLFDLSSLSLALGSPVQNPERFIGNTPSFRKKVAHRRARTDIPFSFVSQPPLCATDIPTATGGNKDTDSKHRQLAFIIDIDSCLFNKGVPIPESKEALHKLQSMSIPFVLCTNGGGQLEATRAQHLSKILDMKISPDQVLLSHSPLRDVVVPRLNDDRVLIIGENCADVARAYGLARAEGVREYGQRHPSLFPRRRLDVDEAALMEIDDSDDPVRAILFFEDPEDLGETLQVCLDILLTNGNPSGPRVLIENEDATQEVEVWFTNPDIVYSSMARHPRLTQGSYRQCLEMLYESATSYPTSSDNNSPSKNAMMNKQKGRILDAKTVGKPTRLMGNTALAKLFAQSSCTSSKEEDLDIWIVGNDNSNSDVELANAMGWKSALVRSSSGMVWNGDGILDLEMRGEEGGTFVPTKIGDSLALVVEDLLPV